MSLLDAPPTTSLSRDKFGSSSTEILASKSGINNRGRFLQARLLAAYFIARALDSKLGSEQRLRAHAERLLFILTVLLSV